MNGDDAVLRFLDAKCTPGKPATNSGCKLPSLTYIAPPGVWVSPGAEAPSEVDSECGFAGAVADWWWSGGGRHQRTVAEAAELPLVAAASPCCCPKRMCRFSPFHRGRKEPKRIAFHPACR